VGITAAAALRALDAGLIMGGGLGTKNS